jgi:hypothetical protein
MKMFDFNAVQKPTWPVKLGDTDGTVVHLSYPTLELAERLTALATEIGDIAASKDVRAIRSAFGIVAEVMSCNEDGFTFTAEELRDKYRMSLLVMAQFTAGYLEFLQEAKDAKN